MIPSVDSLAALRDAGSLSGIAAPRATRRLSVVVPCYNEQESLAELHRRVSSACRAVAGGDYELVLINDGSTDRTWGLIAALAATDAAVVGIDLARNHGHQLALSAGLSLARGERILIIDADLQDPPELLGEMWSLMDRGADVVYGQRTERQGESWFKKATASAFYRLLDRLTDVRIPPDTGDFRLMSRKVLAVLNAMPEEHRFIRGMVAWIGFRQVPLLYKREPRFAGTTKYPLRKMLRFAVDAITGFSTMPLRLAFYAALGSLLLAGLLAFYVLYSWLFLASAPGWSSLALVVLLFSSLQLCMLGIMGEYVGRTYLQTKRRPLYIINEVCAAPAMNAGPVDIARSPAAELAESEPCRNTSMTEPSTTT